MILSNLVCEASEKMETSNTRGILFLSFLNHSGSHFHQLMYVCIQQGAQV